MKKILILLCLSVTMGFAFAQEASKPAATAPAPTKEEDKKPAPAPVPEGFTPEVSGYGELTWGISLGSGKDARITHGFYNEASVDVSIPFSDKKNNISADHDENADVYADLSVSVNNKGDILDDLEARLVFFGAYITVYDRPDFSSNYGKGWKSITGGRNDWFKPSFDGWGTKIGYANEDIMGLDVGLKFGSNGDWGLESSKDDVHDRRYPDDEEKNKSEEYLYGIGLDFSMEPVKDYLSVDLTFNSTFNGAIRQDVTHGGYLSGVSPFDPSTRTNNIGGIDGTTPMINFGIGVGSKPIEGLSIGLGADFAYALTYQKLDASVHNAFGWDVGFKTAYKWVDFALYACGVGTPLHGFNHRNGWKNGADMAMHIGFATDADEEDDTNFIKGLDIHAVLNVYNLLSKYSTQDKKMKLIRPIGMNLGASYQYNITDSMWIKPFFDIWGESNRGIMKNKSGVKDFEYKDDTKDADKLYYFGLAYEVGIEYQPIEHAVITVKWGQGKLNKKKFEGGWQGDYMLDTPMNHKMDNGLFTLGLRLSF